jgi:hypothetical protein
MRRHDAVLAAVPLTDAIARVREAFNGQFVKTVVDGVVTALHAHGDARTAAVVAERLTHHLPLPAHDIARLLVDDERAGLGICHRLVVLRGQGVQCQPEDGRISKLRIELDRSASKWFVSGEVISMSHT